MKYVLSAFALLSAIILTVNPKAAGEAVGAAVFDCLEVVVPSLFAFTILAVYMQKSGLYRVALRPITFPLSKLLRLDEELCAVYVLSNIGGYPVGAKLLSELVWQGRLSAGDAGRMLCFCFGSGPGFMIGIAGMKIFGSAGAGLALFGISFVTSLLIAAFVRSRGEIRLQKAEKAYMLGSDAFISSVTDAARVMFTVCAMIAGFSVVSAVLRSVGVYALFEKLFGSAEIFPALLEVTRISGLTPTAHALPVCAALLSFGGVCVIMQVAALTRKASPRGIPLVAFLVSRACAAVISALLALPFAERFPPVDVQTLASDTAVVPFTKNAALSLCVLAMCVLAVRGEKNKL